MYLGIWLPYKAGTVRAAKKAGLAKYDRTRTHQDTELSRTIAHILMNHIKRVICDGLPDFNREV